jgi:hypothetical protein
VLTYKFCGHKPAKSGKSFPQKYSHIKRVYPLFGLDYKKILGLPDSGKPFAI